MTGAVTAAGTVAAAALRVAAVLPNVTAVGALGLFAGGRLPRWLAWAPPLAAMAAGDVALHLLYGYPMFNPWVYAAVLGYVLLGRLLAGTASPGRIGAVTLFGSVQFFLLTNFGVWWNSHGLANALYPPTAGGLLACYAAALPFFGYTLLGDFGFTAVLFGAHAWLTRPAAEPAPVAEEVRA